MNYVQAPAVFGGGKPDADGSDHPRDVHAHLRPAIFLAGGITGCPEWQRLATLFYADTCTIINPRRAGEFRPEDAEAQIRWEFDHLRMADGIAFWFPKETLCPIALYELGRWGMTDKPLAVGVHEEYGRRFDVELQMRLARPDVPVAVGWEAFVVQALDLPRRAR
jgi:hypothetical protein